MKEKQMTDVADNAMKNYEQAVRTGLKLQEEAGKWWTNMFSQAGFGEEWQRRFNGVNAMTSGFVPLAQKRVEEMMDFMQKNGRTTADLMKKAVEAAQSPGMAESQAKWMEFWTSSIGALRNNTEAMAQMNSKAIDSWIEYVRKNADYSETRASRSA
jgi:hypothetical protein